MAMLEPYLRRPGVPRYQCPLEGWDFTAQIPQRLPTGMATASAERY